MNQSPSTISPAIKIISSFAVMVGILTWCSQAQTREGVQREQSPVGDFGSIGGPITSDQGKQIDQMVVDTSSNLPNSDSGAQDTVNATEIARNHPIQDSEVLDSQVPHSQIFDSQKNYTYRQSRITISTPSKRTAKSSSQSSYVVQIADTPRLRTLGLSDRFFLLPKTGMLFVFDQEGHYPFWMKDMNFAIDIIWINADKQIVHIEKNVDPQTYPQSFGSDAPAQYVLEIPAGEAELSGFEIGDKVEVIL